MLFNFDIGYENDCPHGDPNYKSIIDWQTWSRKESIIKSLTETLFQEFDSSSGIHKIYYDTNENVWKLNYWALHEDVNENHEIFYRFISF